MTTKRFDVGDAVRVDIPDETDPDFEPFHGETGVVVRLLEDDAGWQTGDGRDNVLYRVDINDGEKMDFRWRDLRPAPEK